MPEQEPVGERPETLRERARWYRAFASTDGDAEGALRLADHLERPAADAKVPSLRAARLRRSAEPDPK